MSSSGSAVNSYLYGGNDGNPVTVTIGGNVATTTVYKNIKNVGRIVLRLNQTYQLPDIPAAWVTIHSDSTNGTIFLAGIADQAPQVDVGFPIVAGSTITIPCTNSNQMSVTTDTDGDIMYVVVGAVDNSASNLATNQDATIDRVPPIIISSTPLTSATNVPTNQQISILANKNLDPSTVNNSTVSISPTPSNLDVVIDSTNASNILLLYTGTLAFSTTYTITVSTGVKSYTDYALAGAYTTSFTTAAAPPPPDTTPPSLLSSNPAANTTGVPISTNPTLSFSEAIAPASITTTSIKVSDLTNSSVLTGYTLSQSLDQKTVTIGSLTLEQGTNYRIDVYNTVPTGIKDIAGNYLDNTYSIPFTTEPPPNTTPYNVGGNSYSQLNSYTAYTIVSELLYTNSSSLIGKVPIAYTFVLKKVGNPTGSFKVIWKRIISGNWSDYKVLLTQTAASIGTSDTTVTVTDYSNTVPLQYHDGIAIQYTNGTTTDYLWVKCITSDAFDGSNTCLYRILYDGTTDLKTTCDNSGTITVLT